MSDQSNILISSAYFFDSQCICSEWNGKRSNPSLSSSTNQYARSMDLCLRIEWMFTCWSDQSSSGNFQEDSNQRKIRSGLYYHGNQILKFFRWILQLERIISKKPNNYQNNSNRNTQLISQSIVGVFDSFNESFVDLHFTTQCRFYRQPEINVMFRWQRKYLIE